MTKFQKKKCLEAAEQKTSKLLVVVCCCKTVDFGRNDLKLPWEATDKVEELKKYL